MSETAVKANDTIFQFPEFQIPKFGPPDGLREVVVQWVDLSRKNFDTVIAGAEEAFETYGTSWSTAAKGSADCAAKLAEAMHQNTDAVFGLAHDLMAAKSLPDIIEVSISGARRQFETFGEQSRKLWSLANDAAVETMRPLKAAIPKSFQVSAEN